MNLVDLAVFVYFFFTFCSLPAFLFVPKFFKAFKVEILEKE